jgi:RNA polymerase sigma factor (sigma-70 family)
MAQGVLDLSSDKDLAERALRGQTVAFDELYRRHVGAAWRLAQAVTRNVDDAADAVSEAFARVFDAMRRGVYGPEVPFRPYLLTATRNAAIDAARKVSKVSPTGDERVIDRAEPRQIPHQRAEESVDADFIATAFAGLPERWRSVLWLTEVEGMRPRDAGALLGLSANGAAQLAVRARSGLRQRYLQAHLLAADDSECRRTVSHLGAYVNGTLAVRDTAKVDQHLAACAACRTRVEELEETGTRLRGLMLPLPLVLGPAAAAKWAGVVGASTPTGLALVLPGGQRLPQWAQRALVGAAGAGVAAGILAATILGARDATRPARDLATPAAKTEQPVNDPTGDTLAGDPPTSGAGTTRGSAVGATPVRNSTGSLPEGSGGTTGDNSGGSGGGSGGNGDGVPGTSPRGVVETSVNVEIPGAPTGAAVGVGGGPTGVKVGPVVVGTPPPPSTEHVVEVIVDGTLVGGNIPPIAI